MQNQTISYAPSPWTILCVIIAIILAFLQAYLSAAAILISGLMASSNTFRKLAARGKTVLPMWGRWLVGIAMLPSAFLLLPGASSNPTAKSGPPLVKADVAAVQLDAPAVACSPQDAHIGREMSVRQDAELKTTPDNDAAPVQWSVAGKALPGQIDNSVPVQEVCRRGNWSLVRVLAPADLRRLRGWVTASMLAGVPVGPDGRRLYRTSDFQWPAGSKRYQSAVVAALNRTIAGHRSCETLDLASFTVTGSGESPEFLVACVGDGGTQSIEFGLADVKSRKLISPIAESSEAPHAPSEPRISGSAAFALCRDHIKSQLAHPSTADFDTWDTHVQETATTSIFSVGVKAKNSYGLELKLTGYCEIKDGRVINIRIIEQ